MEARAPYLGRVERPRLTVVKDDGGQERFSALPHAVIRRTDLSRDARLLVAVLQMYGWQGGDITASHATLAADMGCSTRMLRTYLTELIDAGVISEHAAGARRQKVYRLESIGTVLPITEHHNEKQASDSDGVNRKFPTVQSEISDTFNEKPASDLYKKTKRKKTKEEESSSAPMEPARSSTKSGQLIDLLKAADVPVTMRPQDHKALKDSGADPSLVAEAYGALFRGEWGDDFMRRSLSVQFVIGRLAGYEAWKRNPKPATRRNGSDPKPAASPTMSSWSTFKGRHGGSVGGTGQPDAR